MWPQIIRYVAVLVPLEAGGWRAYLPDFPGCAREGPDADTALESATRAAKERIAQLQTKKDRPAPRSPLEIREDRIWAAHRAINWSLAVMSLIIL